MSTFNRGELLESALRSVLAQQADVSVRFELIVVDNNSTDTTRELIERFTALDRRVRYLFESRQGLSYARNAGIAAARAPIVAFTDDDVRVARDWVSALLRAFDERPDAQMVGGRVLPLWRAEPPSWLTREHWAPLALVDHGVAPVTVTAERAICLVGANLACRRELFDAVGLFATDLQRVKDGIGSLEDHEFLLRVLRTGRTALYDPRIVVNAEVQLNRLDREYHRRWHTGHGHFHALMRSEQVERTGRGSLLGVPAHMYRQALVDLLGWARAAAGRDAARALRHEAGLRFFKGFFRTRSRDSLRWLAPSEESRIGQEHA
jgi:glycosyltransferase involved in cell wall biosynthesis